MKVAELIDGLCRSVNIEFRDRNNKFICNTRSTSKGIEPYLWRDVFKWSPDMTYMNTFLCILLDDKSGDAE